MSNIPDFDEIRSVEPSTRNLENKEESSSNLQFKNEDNEANKNVDDINPKNKCYHGILKKFKNDIQKSEHPKKSLEKTEKENICGQIRKILNKKSNTNSEQTQTPSNSCVCVAFRRCFNETHRKEQEEKENGVKINQDQNMIDNTIENKPENDGLNVDVIKNDVNNDHDKIEEVFTNFNFPLNILKIFSFYFNKKEGK